MAFIYKEIIADRYLQFIPNNLNLNKTTFIEAKLIRLLLGTCDIENTASNFTIHQRKNYSDAQGTIYSRISSKTLKDCLSPFTLLEVDSYLNNTKNNNYSLINDLIIEYTYFLINESNENYTSAFVHLYRILEYISYTFPLVHASTSKNYIGTFQSLQSYFLKDAGELSFLVKFVDKLFENQAILNATTDIQIPENNIYRSFKRTIPQNLGNFDDSYQNLSIKYSKLIEVIISIRNRYFHFSVGGKRNIKSSEIVDPDQFFKQINEPAINWLTIIYFEVLRFLIDRWK